MFHRATKAAPHGRRVRQVVIVATLSVGRGDRCGHPVRDCRVQYETILPCETLRSQRAEAFRREQVRVHYGSWSAFSEQRSGSMKGTSERAKAGCYPAEMPGCGNDLWPSPLE
jgi:hypothetical protein